MTTRSVFAATFALTVGVGIGSLVFAQSKPSAMFFGPGDKTCAAWTAGNQSGGAEAQVMHAWVLGYVSGGATVSPVPLAPLRLTEKLTLDRGSRPTIARSMQTSLDAPEIIEWVNTRCEAAPAELLNTVASELMRQLTRQGPN